MIEWPGGSRAKWPWLRRKSRRIGCCEKLSDECVLLELGMEAQCFKGVATMRLLHLVELVKQAHDVSQG